MPGSLRTFTIAKHSRTRRHEAETPAAPRVKQPGDIVALVPHGSRRRMEIDSGNTAWVLTSAALVLLMTPGLALFYGGMGRSTSVLNMLMMSFSALGIVSVLWVLYGYAISFGATRGGLFGFTAGLLGLNDLTTDTVTAGLPDLAFAGFQLMFAVLTVALISGAVADRMKFGAWVAFVVLWASVVYFPVAHWVFNFGVLQEDGGFAAGTGGWIVQRLGALDFAGGTAVHINAGAAALALVLVLGRRRGFGREPMRPHNLPLVLLGAGLLWFGWFGFNAGSALGATGTAALALVNTQVATAAALIAWIGTERLRDGHATTLGAASGAVAGLVAITPACAAVKPVGALTIGLVSGAACALAVTVKHRLRYDDALDVVGVHLVGGLVGTLMIGLVASESVAGRAGLLLGGGAALLADQAIAALAVLAYSFVVTTVIALLLKLTLGLRVSEEQEATGIDQTVHAESGYELTALGGATSTLPVATRLPGKVSS
jgi:Amt family ammonium transporter